MKTIFLVSALALITTSALADPFDGRYSSDECSPTGVHQEGNVEIRDGHISYYESGCRLSNPVSVRGMNAVLYDGKCSGEGSEWNKRVLLMAHDNGVFDIEDGYIRKLSRCK